MARPPCLYHFRCGNLAEKGEHVFPAGLGGRRESGNLVCQPCNNGLSRLDGALARDMRLLNAQLAVVPDRKDAAVRATALDEFGNAVTFSGDFAGARWETQVERTGEQDGEQLFRVLASTQEDIDRYIHRARQEGRKVRLYQRTKGRRLLARPPKANMSFGGNETFRGVAKVLLNFLAEAAPELARSEALVETKKFILGETNEPRVWFDYTSQVAQLGGWQDEPSHTVVVGATSSGVVFGHLSFFGVARVSMRLGMTDLGRFCHRVQVFPLRRHAGDLDQVVDSPEPPDSPPPEAHDGANPSMYDEGLKRLLDYWNHAGKSRHVDALHAALRHARELAWLDRHRAVAAALDEECQPILTQVLLMAEIVRDALNGQETAPLRALLEDMLAGNNPGEWGVSELARCLVLMTSFRMADALERELVDRVPSKVDLDHLLFGGRGRQLAFEVLREMLTLCVDGSRRGSPSQK